MHNTHIHTHKHVHMQVHMHTQMKSGKERHKKLEAGVTVCWSEGTMPPKLPHHTPAKSVQDCTNHQHHKFALCPCPWPVPMKYVSRAGWGRDDSVLGFDGMHVKHFLGLKHPWLHVISKKDSSRVRLALSQDELSSRTRPREELS